jgi:hypothetical protein
MVDINTLVLPGSDIEIVDAYDINDRGEIAGVGVLPNGDQRGVLLIPATAEECAAADALNTSTGGKGSPREGQEGNDAHIKVKRMVCFLDRSGLEIGRNFCAAQVLATVLPMIATPLSGVTTYPNIPVGRTKEPFTSLMNRLSTSRLLRFWRSRG